MQEHRFPSRYDAYLLLTALIWGVEWPVIKLLYREIPPLAIIALRAVVGFLALLLLVKLRGDREPWRPMSPGECARAMGWGALGCGISPMLAFMALKYSSIGNASLLVNTNPLFGFLLGALFWRMVITRKAWLGIIVSFAGIYLLISSRAEVTGLSLDTFRGDLVALASALSWASYTVAIRSYLQGRSPLKIVCLSMGAGSLAAVLLAAGDLWHMSWAALSLGAVIGILYIGIVASALGVFIWNLGVARLGSDRTIVYNFLIPVVAWTLAVVWLGEIALSGQIIAACFVFAGLYLVCKRT